MTFLERGVYFAIDSFCGFGIRAGRGFDIRDPGFGSRYIAREIPDIYDID